MTKKTTMRMCSPCCNLYSVVRMWSGISSTEGAAWAASYAKGDMKFRFVKNWKLEYIWYVCLLPRAHSVQLGRRGACGPPTVSLDWYNDPMWKCGNAIHTDGSHCLFCYTLVNKGIIVELQSIIIWVKSVSTNHCRVLWNLFLSLF